MAFSFPKFFQVAEADIIALWGKAVADVGIVETDLALVLKWIEQESPGIEAIIVQLSTTLGVIAPFLPAPEAAAVVLTVAGLNAAMASLTAVTGSLTAVSNSTSTAAAIVSGVQAVNAVRLAVASVQAAVKAPVVAKAA